MSRIILHAGLPRTATTALQSVVFPAARNYHYLGKQAANALIRGEFNPLRETRRLIAEVRSGKTEAWDRLRSILPTVLTLVKIANHVPNDAARTRSTQMIRAWIQVINDVARLLPDKPILYSDESLVESVSGLVAKPGRGDDVPLEQLHKEGFLENVKVCIVLREPLEFLRASYYKAMEFRLSHANDPLSWEQYLDCQARILERSPTASRLFLANPARAREHFSKICPQAVITTYRELYESKHVLNTLLGEETGEDPIQLASLPRENKSWRDPAVNQYILKAPGVPAGISIEEYASTFERTMRVLPSSVQQVLG